MGYSITLGDTGPPMSIKIGANKYFQLLAGDTATLVYSGPDHVKRTKAITIADLAGGVVRCDSWSPTDIPVPGTYSGRVVIARIGDPTYPRSYPSKGHVMWIVNRP